VIIERSGSAGQPIVLKGQPGAILSGKSVSGANMILIEDQSHVQVIGFEIRDNLEVKDGSGIRVEGKGSHIELRNNRIHNIRGRDAMGITIYGTNAKEALEHIVIDGNEVFERDPARSEALTLNGNVSNFKVTNNIVPRHEQHRHRLHRWRSLDQRRCEQGGAQRLVQGQQGLPLPLDLWRWLRGGHLRRWRHATS